jgi:hypothetical protein
MAAEADKPYNGSPFGSQSHRFDVSGVHPNSKRMGSYTEVAYDRKVLTPVARQLGPGTHSLKSTDIDQWRDSGPGWERAAQVARFSKIPHLLYRETWEREHNAKLNLGPGRYNKSDFIDELARRCHSARGLLDMYESRFKTINKESMRTPGPGSYGRGGVPHKTFEESSDKSSGKKPMFEWGKNVDRSLPLVGSSVAPGTYEFRSSMEEKKVGARGPYDVFTGSRSAPTTTGHWARPKPVKNRGPGDYEKKAFTDELQNGENAQKGEFLKHEQYPSVPGERIFYTKPITAPVEPKRPGPGYYEKTEERKISSLKNFPFQQQAERFDERAKMKMMGPGAKNVGIGRYDVTKQEKFYNRNGAGSVFNSKVDMRPDEVTDKILKERLKPKVPSARKRAFKVLAREHEDLINTRKMLNQSVVERLN